MADIEFEFWVSAKLRVQYDWVAQKFQALKTCHSKFSGGRPITDRSIASAPKLATFSFWLGHGALLSVDPFTCLPKPEGVLPNYIKSQFGTGRGAQVRNQAGFMALQLRWPVFLDFLQGEMLRKEGSSPLFFDFFDIYFVGRLVSLEWFRKISFTRDNYWSTIHHFALWPASRNAKLCMWLKFRNALKAKLCHELEPMMDFFCSVKWI